MYKGDNKESLMAYVVAGRTKGDNAKAIAAELGITTIQCAELWAEHCINKLGYTAKPTKKMGGGRFSRVQIDYFIEQTRKLKSEGLNNTEIALVLGISTASMTRINTTYLRANKEPLKEPKVDSGDLEALVTPAYPPSRPPSKEVLDSLKTTKQSTCWQCVKLQEELAEATVIINKLKRQKEKLLELVVDNI
jgi:hypothetical protein